MATKIEQPRIERAARLLAIADDLQAKYDAANPDAVAADPNYGLTENEAAAANIMTALIQENAELRDALKAILANDGGVGEIIKPLIDWHEGMAKGYASQADEAFPDTDIRACRAKAEAHEEAAEYLQSQINGAKNTPRHMEAGCNGPLWTKDCLAMVLKIFDMRPDIQALLGPRERAVIDVARAALAKAEAA